MSKRKLAGIIVGSIVVIIVVIVLATRPPAPLPTTRYTLSVGVSPSGAGFVSPPSGEYESDVQVTLTATPASGYAFDRWSGSASGTTSSITIVMDSDKSVTGNFEAIYALTTNASPSAAGSVSPTGGEYKSGTTLTLTASPASGYTFDYWSGSASGTASTITLTIDSDKSLVAHFKVVETEPQIPAHYTTYTDEAELFNISYPREWETALSLIPDLEKSVKGLIKSLEEGLPVEKVSVIFLAGLRTATQYIPSVSIVVEPKPVGTLTHDQVFAAEIAGLRMAVQDFREFSRVKTTVSGRETTIIEFEGTFAGLGRARYLTMMTLAGETVWVVTCTALPDRYDKWEDDFDAIVRSLRILK